MKIKRCFLDTETGGLDPLKHNLIQVAGMIDIDGEVVEEFNFTMQGREGKTYEQKALEVNGLDMKTIESYNPNSKSFLLFRQTLKKYVDQYNPKDKFNFLAYNAPFDVGFIRQWFLDNKDNYYGSLFFRYPIDVASIAMEALIDKRHELKNDRLGTVIKEYGIEPKGDLHDALTDIQVTRDLYYQSLYTLKHNDWELF